MALSLKGRALALLAQREQSRVELRRKLLREVEREEQRERSHPQTAPDDAGERGDVTSAAVRVDALLDWLEAHRYLSPERFIESRVHARSARFGSLRIRQELKLHGLAMPAEAAQALAATELERARSICARKFTAQAETAAGLARQARFLIGRGFSPEVVRQVLRQAQRESRHTEGD